MAENEAEAKVEETNTDDTGLDNIKVTFAKSIIDKLIAKLSMDE